MSNPNRVVVEAIPGYPVIVRAEKPEEVVVLVFSNENQEQPEAFGGPDGLAIGQLNCVKEETS